MSVGVHHCRGGCYSLCVCSDIRTVLTTVRKDATVSTFASQLLVLVGVAVGALGSYLTTAATERARWKRTIDSRWDDRRVAAYAAYARAVRQTVTISQRIAAGRGLGDSTEPLPPNDENIGLLASAEAARAELWETVILLGHPSTVDASRNWNDQVWRLEWYARGLVIGNSSDWSNAVSEVDTARAIFYDAARRDLGVRGGGIAWRDPSDVPRPRLPHDPYRQEM